MDEQRTGRGEVLVSVEGRRAGGRENSGRLRGRKMG